MFNVGVNRARADALVTHQLPAVNLQINSQVIAGIELLVRACATH